MAAVLKTDECKKPWEFDSPLLHQCNTYNRLMPGSSVADLMPQYRIEILQYAIQELSIRLFSAFITGPQGLVLREKNKVEVQILRQRIRREV